jgi:Zn-finger nucleic acid-binding protein
MLCPRCKVSLSTMNLVGYSSNYCSKCEATWLHGADLERRLLANPWSSNLLQQLRELQARGLPPGRLSCPHCTRALSDVDAADVHIDFCCSCGGALFNFEAVRQAHQSGAFVTPAHVAGYVIGDLVINVIIAGLLS